jgi:hypothetical protein
VTQSKHLIKVSLPLQAISTQSAREKSTRHGHALAGRDVLPDTPRQERLL